MSFWSRQLSILLALSSTDRVKRQTGTEIPAQCYAECSADSTTEDSAGVQAEAIGEVPALCATDGPFERELANCTQCIETNSNGAANATEILLIPFDLYINYCDGLNIGEFASAQSVLSSVASQEAAFASSSASLASVQASADSVLGITASSSTVTTTSSFISSNYTYSTPIAISPSPISSSSSTLSTPRVTKTSSPTPIPNHNSNTGTIIGAAVGGSIGGIILIGFIIGFIIMRRRNQRKAILAASQRPEDPHEPPEKPQLHSDDYKPHREELLGTLGKKQYDHTALSELPSNEPVEKTKELPANEEMGAELDNRVKIPKTVHESSQSTKVGSGSNDPTKL